LHDHYTLVQSKYSPSKLTSNFLPIWETVFAEEKYFSHRVQTLYLSILQNSSQVEYWFHVNISSKTQQ